ncbi:MAG: carotenoid 1,2-hydratase [bacterium]|nr:carotenoid 1,2-hydratase [bacterium]
MKRLIIGLLVVVSVAAWADGWKTARADYVWSFPEDHWARAGYKTEWWYFTGHLESESGRRFGYQFTFFRVGLLPEQPVLNSEWATGNLIMGHAAISDLSAGRHVFSEVLYRVVPLLGGFGVFPDSTIAWSRGPAGTEETWTLRWNGEAFDFSMADRAQEVAFSLHTRPVKPRIFQGPDGYSKKGMGASAASQYYSFTRLETVGTVRVGEDTVRVRGQSWMDKEFGSNQLEEHQVGWDWFSLQLDDGRELMLYLLRDRSGAVDFARGTVVSATGQVRYLERGDFTVRATEFWTSTETGATYPAGWELEIPTEGLRIKVVPELADQENRSQRMKTMFYWEGAVDVLGVEGRIGGGYVELVGYGEGNRPRI